MRKFGNYEKHELEFYVQKILDTLDENSEREGLVETPKRVANAIIERMEGMQYTNKEIAEMFNKCFEEPSVGGTLVTVLDIPIFSTCEHHLMLMYNMKVHVGYLPKNKVIGLSKVARIADMCSKRLQLQERIGTDIVDVLKHILDTKDIAVVIEGEHACMAARGIAMPGTVTRTAALSGAFLTDTELRQEFYSLLK